MYLHDRGITKECVFWEKGVRCLLPDFTQHNQVVFSEESSTRSRAVATERIPAEQNMRKMRMSDGFHGLKTVKSLSLAECEG